MEKREQGKGILKRSTFLCEEGKRKKMKPVRRGEKGKEKYAVKFYCVIS